MNNKQAQIAATTGVATFGAEFLIGGLGVGLLGTAVAVPASLVVATVGTIAFFAAGDDSSTSSTTNQVTDKQAANHLTKSIVKTIVKKPSVSDVPPYNFKTFVLKKGTITHKIFVDNVRGVAYTCLNATSTATWTNYRWFKDIQEGRDFYKSLLAKGYVAA